MSSVIHCDAKTLLSDLLPLLQSGESISIIQGGEEVAVLTPPRVGEPKTSLHDAIAAMLEIRSRVEGPGMDLKELVNEGRRY